MGIFSRISDIISADLNNMVERFEDPEKMLRQALREMEAAIATSKREVAKAMANEKYVAKELASNEAAVVSWSSRAEAAVANGDDDLARKALERKRGHEKIAAALRDQHEASAEAARALRTQLEGMQAKHAEAERQLGTLTARKKAADVKARASRISESSELDQRAFEKFERMRKKVEMAEAEAEAMAELAAGDRKTIDDDFEPVEPKVDIEIEAELAALKQKRSIE